jgi:hypothetical protein
MKRPWLRTFVAGIFGSLVALACFAEAVVFRLNLPW